MAKRVENEYGLTFEEWLAAAGGRAGIQALIKAGRIRISSWTSIQTAWRGGDDPSDWRKATSDLAHQTFKEKNMVNGDEVLTHADFRPRTRKGYYKSGVNVVRVDDVLPYRSAHGVRLGVADWWVYGTMTLTTPDRDGPSPGTQSATLQVKLYEFTSSNWKRIDAARLSPKWKVFFARNPAGDDDLSNRARGSSSSKRKSPLSAPTRVATLTSLGVDYDSSLFYSVKAGKLYARERTGSGGYGRGRLGKAKLLGTIPGFKKGVFYSVSNGVISARRRK